jgi:hypothetical protein
VTRLLRRARTQVKYKGDKPDEWLPAAEVDQEMVAKFEAKRAGKEKRPAEASDAGKPAKAIKSEAGADASSASASAAPEAAAPSPVPDDLQPSVFSVMKKYLEKEAIESLTKKKVRACWSPLAPIYRLGLTAHLTLWRRRFGDYWSSISVRKPQPATVT